MERQEQFERALAEYQASVRLNSSDPRARARLGDLALRLRRLDLAEQELIAVAAMNTGRPKRIMALDGWRSCGAT